MTDGTGAATGAYWARRGLWMIAWSMAALTVLGAMAIPPQRYVIVVFGSNDVLVRPWMQVFNGALMGLHFLLLPFLWGGIYLTRHLVTGWAAVAQRGALILIGAAILATAGLLVFPLVTTQGPWPPDSLEVVVLTGFCFAPGVLRSAGWAMLSLATLGWYRGRRPSWLVALVGVFWTDCVLTIWWWIDINQAVFARIFVLYDYLPWLVVWALATVAFLVSIVRRSRAGDLTPDAT